MSFKSKDLSSAMKRTSDWIFSQEIPSDVTIHAGGASFSLHKFPLISKCGYIRKLISDSNDTDVTVLEIPEIPGGPEAFELAAKFCYGINFEIGTDNIAMLRCIAEFLEMTEDYGVENLVARTEAYLKEVALKSLAGAVTVLHLSENLLPLAEQVKLVSRCIDAIAYLACKESQFSVPGRPNGTNEKPILDWWAEDLTVLRIDMFQRVLVAMMSRGFKHYAIGPILMLYAQKSLRGLEMFGKGRKKIELQLEHEKRVVLETIVSLLPRERNVLSVSFLSMLLRAAIYLETTVACRLDLEKRMALQLGQAALDDLLIPTYTFTGDTLFDIDTIQRVMVNYLEFEAEENRFGFQIDHNEFVSPLSGDIERVAKLMESYIAEIASDRNLTVAKFIGLVELIPEHSRITEDGIYRAIDIFLKAHPDLSDMERKKVCSVMDCQKLSREACAHAAQNDRLPVQTVVQVLYYEQQRLRDVMDTSLTACDSLAFPTKLSIHSTDIHPVSDELLALRKENEDLKLELAKMKMRLKEFERSSNKSATSSPVAARSATGSPVVHKIQHSAEKPPLYRKSFMHSVSKRLGKLVPFGDAIPKGRTEPVKSRRHSMS